MVIHNTVLKQYSPIFYVKWNAHPVMSAVITHHWCWDAMRETNPNGNLKTRQAKSLWHSETWHFQAFSGHSETMAQNSCSGGMEQSEPRSAALRW